MVVLRFGDGRDAVDEGDRFDPVLDIERLDQLLVSLDQPAFELLLQRHDLVMGQRRRAAAARDALLVGEICGHQFSLSTLAIVARSASSGPVSSQASQISLATASGVARRLITRMLASFHLRAPLAVSASPPRAARTPGTLLAAIDTPVPVQQNSTPC